MKIGTCEEFQGEERLVLVVLKTSTHIFVTSTFFLIRVHGSLHEQVMIVSTVRSVESAPNHPPSRKAVAQNTQWRRTSGPRPSSRGPKTAHPACANVPNETDCGGDDENSDPDSGLGIAPGTLAGVQNGQQRGLPRLAEVRAHRPWSALGFLVDPRRFNVAITRARALLICVGDPMLLIQVCSRSILFNGVIFSKYFFLNLIIKYSIIAFILCRTPTGANSSGMHCARMPTGAISRTTKNS